MTLNHCYVPSCREHNLPDGPVTCPIIKEAIVSEQLGWNLGLGENGFASALEFYGTAYDQAKVWEAAVDFGFDGIELHPRYHPVPAPAEVLRELRNRADSTGLRISGVQTQGPNPCLGATEAKAYVDMLKRAIDGAVILGADVVGCWPGASMPDVPDAEKIAKLAEAYRQVTPIAQSAGLILSLEPEPVVIVDSIDMAMGLVEAVQSPAFTLLYDVAHADVLGNADPVAVLQALGEPHRPCALYRCRWLLPGDAGRKPKYQHAFSTGGRPRRPGRGASRACGGSGTPAGSKPTCGSTPTPSRLPRKASNISASGCRGPQQRKASRLARASRSSTFVAPGLRAPFRIGKVAITS